MKSGVAPAVLRRGGAALVALALAFSAAARAATHAGVDFPPPLPPRPVTDVYWETPVVDPYRFLEDTGDPEVKAWMRAQADAAEALFARIPGRDALLARLREIDDATPGVVSAVHRDRSGRLFYLKRPAGHNQFKLYRRDTPDGPERLLVDPDVLTAATGQPHAIGAFTPSPDGRHVAYSIAASGGEIGTLHLIDARSGREAMPPIDRIRGGGVTWLPDGSGFFYERLRENYAALPRAERFLDNLTWLRRLADPAADRAVFGPGLDPGLPLERTASADITVSPGARLATAVVRQGVERYLSLYVTEAAALRSGKPRWRPVFAASAQVSGVAVAGGYVYLKSARAAPRFEVLRIKLDAPDLAGAVVVLAASESVVGDLAAARDALYVTRREGVVKRLWRLPHAAAARPQPVELPDDGSVDIADADPQSDGAIVELGSWTRAVRYYEVGPGARKPRLLPLVPPGRFDAPDGIAAREVEVRSHDGVAVPLSIISRADLRLDGSHPAILYGYGAYGTVEEPGWSPRQLAWLERGGILAIAHVRGGGVHGDAWHKAGHKTTKPNTWKDGIAAAEWLIANGYTATDRLAVLGGSAGGIFVGRAITERPDLFAAAVISVGNTDSLRSETRANGAANIPEYGTVRKEEEFRALKAMSPYANIVDGTPYPAVLFEHGVNDIRVDVWMALKTGSRLAAASTSGRPVVLRLEYDGGHGPGTTREQALRRVADRWSFLLWQAGVPAFQPRTP